LRGCGCDICANLLRVSTGIELDDAISADIAALPFLAMLKFVTWNDPNMSFYYVLLHFWSALAGNSPLALRMLSILFSAAAVAAIYLLGCRLFNQSVGLTAAFLLAANATAVEYAQIIRPTASYPVGHSFLVFLREADRFSEGEGHRRVAICHRQHTSCLYASATLPLC